MRDTRQTAQFSNQARSCTGSDLIFATVKRRILTAGFVGAILGIAFFVSSPSATRDKFPGRFSENEKREISSSIRWDAYHQSILSFAHGEFRQSWHWIVNARKQEVYAVGDQPDGQIWVHVGVKDRSQPEGYYLSARYFLKNEKEHWKITTLL